MPETRDLRELLDQGTFWGRVASGCVGSLVTAYTVTTVGSVIAVAAVGEPGTPLNWVEAFAAMALMLTLGGNLVFLGWSAFLVAVGGSPAPGKNSAIWRILDLTVGAFATASVGLYTPGWWPLSAIGVLAASLVASSGPLRGSYGTMLTTPPGRWRVWLGGGVALVGTVITGVVLGGMLGRALG